MVIPYRFELCTWHHRNNWPPFPRKESRRLLFFLLVGKSMDVYFKSYKTGMVTVKEKYPCDRGDGKGRNHVYYLCQCDYGKEFIVSGDELSRHPYSCGCTPKPMKGKGRPNNWALGYDEKEHTMFCMIKPTRAVCANAFSEVSSVNWEPQRKRRRAKITIKRKTIYLGYFRRP